MFQGSRPRTSAPREVPPPGRYRDLESVQLRADLPDQGLKTGEVGTIVHVFDVADAYLVEFVNDDGSTRALAELTPEKLAPA